MRFGCWIDRDEGRRPATHRRRVFGPADVEAIALGSGRDGEDRITLRAGPARIAFVTLTNGERVTLAPSARIDDASVRRVELRAA